MEVDYLQLVATEMEGKLVTKISCIILTINSFEILGSSSTAWKYSMEIFDGGVQWTMAASMPSISGRVVPVVM